MQHLPHENRVLGASPLQNPVLMLGGRLPGGPILRPGKSRKSLSAALGAFLGRSWSFFGRSLLLLGASCGAGGLRQASGVDFRCHVGSILDHFGCFFKLCLGCIVRCVFRLFSVLFFLLFQVFWAARETRPKSENRHTLHAKTCFFKVRARARAGARETTEGQKRHPT